MLVLESNRVSGPKRPEPTDLGVEVFEFSYASSAAVLTACAGKWLDIK
jgi:hypothetical protein